MLLLITDSVQGGGLIAIVRSFSLSLSFSLYISVSISLFYKKNIKKIRN